MAYIINIVGIHSPGCEYGIKAKKMASFPYFLTWAVYLKMIDKTFWQLMGITGDGYPIQIKLTSNNLHRSPVTNLIYSQNYAVSISV